MAISKIIGSGLGTINSPVEFTSADNLNQLTLSSTDADAGEGPNLVFYRNSSSPADNDDLSTIDFIGRNDASQDVTYGQIKTVLLDASDGTEDARLEFYRMKGGTSSPDLQLNSEGVVINEGSGDVDFRVESNSNANMLFVDGGNNAVVVGANDADTTISGGTPSFQVIGTGIGASVASTRRENNQYGAALIMSKSRNTTPDAFTVVQAGDTLGSLIFIGDDGTNLDTYGATISNVVKSGVGENDMPTELIFSTNSGTTTVAERMKVQHDSGNNVVIADGLTLTDGNLIIGGSGHGIDFGATGNVSGTSSEILGDYEEGTWTPTIASDAQPSGYTTQVGYYRKIGSLVHIHATIQVSGLGSFSGAVINLNGLPFTVSNLTSYREVGTLVLDGTANAKEHIYLVFTANSTTARLEQINGNVGHDNNMNANAFDTGTIMHASGTYIAS